MQRKGATKAQALEAVAKLEDYGLLNEERYAQRVYEAWLAKRYYGRQHLQMELTKRGIRPDVAAEIMERFTPDIEEQQAENAAQLFVQRNQRKLTAETDNKKYMWLRDALWRPVAFHQDMCTLYWVNCIFQTIYSG